MQNPPLYAVPLLQYGLGKDYSVESPSVCCSTAPGRTEIGRTSSIANFQVQLLKKYIYLSVQCTYTKQPVYLYWVYSCRFSDDQYFPDFLPHLATDSKVFLSCLYKSPISCSMHTSQNGSVSRDWIERRTYTNNNFKINVILKCLDSLKFPWRLETCKKPSNWNFGIFSYLKLQKSLIKKAKALSFSSYD